MTKKNDAPAREETTAPKITIGAVVEQLLVNAELSYDQIVDMIRERFPEANTTRRSVASVAARLRKKGTEVPMRRSAKAE